MPDIRNQDAGTGRDIASGQFKPRGSSGGSLLALMVGPKSTEEGLIWNILGRVAPGASGIIQQVMRYADQSVQSSTGEGQAPGGDTQLQPADTGSIPGLE